MVVCLLDEPAVHFLSRDSDRRTAMSDDGQYEDLDFPQLSQEELALLDKEISHAYEVQEINELRAWLSDNPEPALHIVLENSQPYLAEVVPSPVSPPIGTPRTTINVQSPYERHRRRRNALSVTDLTSLAWYAFESTINPLILNSYVQV